MLASSREAIARYLSMSLKSLQRVSPRVTKSSKLSLRRPCRAETSQYFCQRMYSSSILSPRRRGDSRSKRSPIVVTPGENTGPALHCPRYLLKKSDERREGKTNRHSRKGTSL